LLHQLLPLYLPQYLPLLQHLLLPQLLTKHKGNQGQQALHLFWV
jgi:hypothetical protein